MTLEFPESAKLGLTVKECCAVLGIKKTSFYKLAASHEVVVFKIRGRRLVEPQSVQALVDRAIAREISRLAPRPSVGSE